MCLHRYKALPGATSFRLFYIRELLKDLDPLTTVGTKNVLSIEVFDLDNAPEYECVSYAWCGTVTDHQVALLDGGPIEVTASLFEALPYMIAASNTGYLFIDQICINQRNTDERKQQVALMSDIYRNATRLLAWLSTENEITEMVCEMLLALPPAHSILVNPVNTEPISDSDIEKYGHVGKFRKQDAAALQDLFDANTPSFGDSMLVAKRYRDALLEVFDLPWVCSLLNR